MVLRSLSTAAFKGRDSTARWKRTRNFASLGPGITNGAGATRYGKNRQGPPGRGREERQREEQQREDGRREEPRLAADPAAQARQGRPGHAASPPGRAREERQHRARAFPRRGL